MQPSKSPPTRSLPSGWRDLNSRPLDPQEREHRYLQCSRVLADAFLSVNPAIGRAVADLSYPLVIGSTPAQPPTRRR
jgi:hypothetical protein